MAAEAVALGSQADTRRAAVAQRKQEEQVCGWVGVSVAGWLGWGGGEMPVYVADGCTLDAACKFVGLKWQQ